MYINQISLSASDYQEQQQTQDMCMFCEATTQQFPEMMQEALFGKHSSSVNLYYTKQINEIIDEAFTFTYVRFREFEMLDDDDEYLKRQYGIHEYAKKIENLAEYYKFHKEVPRFFGLPIQKTLTKFYDRKRQYQYKKIKKILKENNNNEDMPSEQTSFSHSSYIKKSKYSTMLVDLKKEFEKQDEEKRKQEQQSIKMLDMLVEKSESIALFEIYEKLNQITKGKGEAFQIGGSYLCQNNKDNFENWLKDQSKSKVNHIKYDFSKKKNSENAVVNDKSKNEQSKKRPMIKLKKQFKLNAQIKNALRLDKKQQTELLHTKKNILMVNLQNKNNISNSNSTSKNNTKNRNELFMTETKPHKVNTSKERSLEKASGATTDVKSKPSSQFKFATLEVDNRAKQHKQQKPRTASFDIRKRVNSIQKIQLRSEFKSATRRPEFKETKGSIMKGKKSQSVPTIKNQIKFLKKPQIESKPKLKKSFVEYMQEYEELESHRAVEKEKILKSVKKRLNFDPSQLYKRIKSMV